MHPSAIHLLGTLAEGIHQAVGDVIECRANRKLNQLALNLIDGDGLLVSCSCSYHLPADELSAAIQAAARHSARFVQILEIGGQSADHPVHPAITETRYLKAFFCRVT